MRGADRRNKLDAEKAQASDSRDKLQPAYDYTILNPVSPLLALFPPAAPAPASSKASTPASRSNSTSATTQPAQTRVAVRPLPTPHSIKAKGAGLEFSERLHAGEVERWLESVGLGPEARAKLRGFTGWDLGAMDMEQKKLLLGPADAIRLHNLITKRPPSVLIRPKGTLGLLPRPYLSKLARLETTGTV